MATTLSLKSNTMTWKLGFPLQVPTHRMPRTTSCFMKADQFRCTIKCLFLQKQHNQKPLHSMGHMEDNSFSLQLSSSLRSYYSVPSKPTLDYFFSTPFYSPSPFDFDSDGIFTRQISEFGVVAESTFYLMLVGYAVFMLFSKILSYPSKSSLLTTVEKTTVLKVQVGLLGTDHSLQRNLNRIAKVADTSTAEGLSSLLAETTLTLLRYPDYYISAYSSVDIEQGIEDGEKCFNQLSNEERGKINEEMPINVNNIKKQSESSQRANGFNEEYIVITILAVIEGAHKLPAINKRGDLKEVLQKLGSIPSSKLLAVEVIWTPRDENDTLSGQELLKDYPFLRPL